MKKKYFIFLFTAAILTRIWYSDLFSNYSYSLTDVLLALLISYGLSWFLWDGGKTLLLFIAKGIAIWSGEEKPNPASFKDFISWFIVVIIFILLASLISRIS
ncbi:hypothetical protein HYZ05_00015 [Candidatus Daviesbacteria bacterium]|nr:hypothetical protein [Candidatus Daviesbacteria bacterium]